MQQLSALGGSRELGSQEDLLYVNMFVDPGPVAEPGGQESLAGQTDKEREMPPEPGGAGTELALSSGGRP